MNSKRAPKFLMMLLAAMLAAGVVLPSSAQTQTPGVTRPRTTATPPLAAPSPASTAEETTTEDAIYGLQGVLVETLDGSVVSTQAADDTFNPASALKLATALVALRTFGPEHRFSTGAWTDGSIDKATGTINGNLYVSGRDPSFHYEHGVMIARQLNALGIRAVNGDLVIAPAFTMNFNWSARASGARLYETLDASLRSGEATRSWLYERGLLGDKASLVSVPSVVVMGEVRVEPVAANARLLLSHHSSRLVDILKVLLCYSNNFMAERIGDSIGGVQAVRRNLIETLGLTPDQIQMSSLSGLGINRASPRTMMKIFRALREELRKHRLSTTDIMPVAGIDPGTMETRFTQLPYRGSVIAKTGTLIRTDGGASSLVGQMKTASGATLLFVIMNRRGNVLKFRSNQDFLVMQIQSSRGGPSAFSYKPRSLAMKLSDTQSSFASNGDEFEPVIKLSTAP